MPACRTSLTASNVASRLLSYSTVNTCEGPSWDTNSSVNANQDAQLLCRTETKWLCYPGPAPDELCNAPGCCFTLLCCLSSCCCLDLGYCCCIDLHNCGCVADCVKRYEKACESCWTGWAAYIGRSAAPYIERSAAEIRTTGQQDTGNGEGAHVAEVGRQLTLPGAGLVSSFGYGITGLSVRTSALAA